MDVAYGGIDWSSIARELDEFGVALTGPVLSGNACVDLRALYDRHDHFRSHIIMQRHGFGAGEYKYFANPLPEIISELRGAFYARLVPIANEWNRRMGVEQRYPETLDDFLAECHTDGQKKPTPLLLKYRLGRLQ